ncbi:MAG: hypothetical protein WC794_04255 [Candidatus Doudnabacteria bacterium]|jgi:Tfp pilus assembly protein PilV
MKNKKINKISSAGQTLIETLAALFILVMGVTAATGLAIYSFSASTSITKQIIATGLAREGIEVVKNMRDTNWLKQSPIDTNCYNYASSTAFNASCYKSWLNATGGYNIGNPPVTPVRLGINGTFANNASAVWVSTRANSNWGLNFNSGAAMANSSFTGFYSSANVANGSSGFYRQIVLTENNTGNYSQAEFHRLVVESRVWWTDKKCPKRTTWPGLGKCSVSLVTNLTNWKDYQLLQ